jgi:hypothetical protein
MPGMFEPQSSEYEQDDDGFSESEGVMREGAGLRAPGSEEILQSTCPRRHKRKVRARRCPLCFIEIPARD